MKFNYNQFDQSIKNNIQKNDKNNFFGIKNLSRGRYLYPT